MADNCPSLETWSFRSPFADIDAFARETETFTRALQMSLFNDSDVLAGGATTLGSFLAKPEPPASLSVSDVEISSASTRGARTPLLSPPAGKMKRKSRAAKRTTSTTTYIAADPANFRQMVQQVTGIRFAGAHNTAETVLMKPEPQRLGSVCDRVPLQDTCLPTLDTSSSFLLDRPAGWVPAPSVAPSPPSHASSFDSPSLPDNAAFELDQTFPCFPTLESWSAM